MDKVLAVVLNYNGNILTGNLFLKTIKSLKNQTYKDLKILVVDNCSHDDSLKLIQHNFPDVEIIELSKNYKTCSYNFGLSYALKDRFKYTLLSNNDMFYRDDFIENMVSFANKFKDGGIFTPKILFLDDPDKVNSTGLVINKTGYAYDRDFGKNLKDLKRESGEVTGGSGGAMFLRTEIVKRIGYFEKFYSAYYEDLDFSFKLRRFTEYKILYNENSVCYHKFSSSWKNSKIKDYYMNRNRFFFIMVHFPLNLIIKSIKFLIFNQKNSSKELDYLMYIDIFLNLPFLLLKRINYLRKEKLKNIVNYFENYSGFPEIE
ncbi:MAG: glycosyltransferase family 2 protein [candidate division WOR-3 bacterium]